MRAFKIKVKSLVHLFKGGGSPEGGAIWSLSADSEIHLLTVKIIKAIADRLKSPKAACTVSSKLSKMKVSSQINLKLFHAGGLKLRAIS